MSKRYQVISPDGLSVTPRPIEGETNAARAMAFFTLRFRHQGYYARADGARIELDDIPLYCNVREVA